jgi:hypothetical protein
MPLTAGRRGDSRKVLLNLENLTATSPAPAYDVYLGIPENGDPRSFATRFAGRISTFGIVEASTADERRSGSGLSVAIDVTRIVEQLNATPGWDASKLSVSFVPTKQSAAAEVIVGRRLPPRVIVLATLAAWSALLLSHSTSTNEHDHHDLAHWSSSVLQWLLMILAMMLPLLGPPLAHVRRRSFAEARIIASTGFVLGYEPPRVLRRLLIESQAALA